ncbi:MAG: type 1 glutamine amidotransferase domain-containing protein [Candidatus Hydrothermarchaeales archaeon]
MGKRAAILAEELFEDLELWYPRLRLREAGCEVEVLGTGREEYVGKHGLSVEVDKRVAEAKATDYDAVIIPGGWAPDRLRRYKEVLRFVKTAFDEGKVIASICHGASVLISAGVLKGKRLTCFYSIKDDVVNAGADYEDREVVVDGNLITSRHPDDLPAFCKEILKALNIT